MSTRGKLITVDGIDGCGKTTFIKMLQHRFELASAPTQVVSILRDTPVSAEIRAIVTGTKHPLHPTAEACLYIAAVLNTYHEKIVPLLEQGVSVICDRSHISTLAYQINDQLIAGNTVPRDLACSAYAGIVPDSIILLYSPVDVAMKRVHGRDGALDRIEARNSVYFDQIQDFFRDFQRITFGAIPTYAYENAGSIDDLATFADRMASILSV